MFKNMGLALVMCTVVISGLLFYERKKNDRAKGKKDAEFWKAEDHANTVRRKDITYLPYIEIPVDHLPLERSSDSEVREYQDTIRSLSTKKILNFNGVTNTELKERYGVANLSVLSEYDENYTTLVNTLARWGARLIALEENTDALTVLEYGIAVGTDVSRNYYMLADLYRKGGESYKIASLIEAADKLESIMKPQILEKLGEMQRYSENSYAPSRLTDSAVTSFTVTAPTTADSAAALSAVTGSKSNGNTSIDSPSANTSFEDEDETMRLIESLDALKDTRDSNS